MDDWDEEMKSLIQQILEYVRSENLGHTETLDLLDEIGAFLQWQRKNKLEDKK